ncbi:hypothetical protein BHE74_00041334 [Ensete ventricosum]|uniref:Uncharacterized protein n=1 Tax=Ensete ventricosum TaxID=4639 RepID=A0A426ZQN0_ENSVE|nr:hypothetical protein B296_00040380 [Ensete ventricosum]RWW52253.1 hypothetical protein BHE74_00041334 [Ensete ventricosum]
MAPVGAARMAEKRPQMHANSSSASPPLHPPPQCSSFENASGEEGSNVDRVLFKNLVDMVPLVESLMDETDENGMQKMEEARIAYVAAVATAKENPSEESIAAAAEARVHLQAYLLNCH